MHACTSRRKQPLEASAHWSHSSHGYGRGGRHLPDTFGKGLCPICKHNSYHWHFIQTLNVFYIPKCSGGRNFKFQAPPGHRSAAASDQLNQELALIQFGINSLNNTKIFNYRSNFQHFLKHLPFSSAAGQPNANA